MKKLTKKQVDAMVDDAFRRLGSNIQFNIFDLSKVSAAGRTAVEQGKDLDTAMNEAIAKYRQN